MDKLLAGSRMNDSSIYKKQEKKIRETATKGKAAEVVAEPEKQDEEERIQTALKKIKEEQENNGWKLYAERAREFKKLQRIKNRATYNATKDLTRLASATTIPSVNSIAGNVRRQMGKIRNSGAAPEEIQLALGKMKGVIRKANAKAGKLRLEMQIESRQKLAEAMNDDLEQEKLKRELKRKIRARTHEENMDILKAKKEELGNLYSSGTGAPMPSIPSDLNTLPVAPGTATPEVGSGAEAVGMPGAIAVDIKL